MYLQLENRPMIFDFFSAFADAFLSYSPFVNNNRLQTSMTPE